MDTKETRKFLQKRRKKREFYFARDELEKAFKEFLEYPGFLNKELLEFKMARFEGTFLRLRDAQEAGI